ncbi:hypothetical protein PF003_g30084 [Phytophthora fragariae]|nr:hypothetical protein PF003_g30084 [Phytophthora fragariae]
MRCEFSPEARQHACSTLLAMQTSFVACSTRRRSPETEIGARVS